MYKDTIQGQYYRMSEPIPIHIVVGAMEAGKQQIQIPDYGYEGFVSVCSSRLRTYTKGTWCVNCGLKASFFLLERQSNRPHSTPHLNLYSLKELSDGKIVEVMMTSDHILAKAWGGGDTLKNRQPMCGPCNFRKSDLRPGEYSLIRCPAKTAVGKIRDLIKFERGLIPPEKTRNVLLKTQGAVEKILAQLAEEVKPSIHEYLLDHQAITSRLKQGSLSA